jgi:hypothetical protein
MTMQRRFWTAVLVLAACDDGAGAPGGGGQGGATGAGQCAGDSSALVALTDYMTPGHAARIDLVSYAVTDNVLALGEDSALKRIGDTVYVINEFGATDADNVLALAAAGLTHVRDQTSTGHGSDPSDLVVGDDGTLYVAELEGPGIAVLAPGQSTVHEIDLSDLDPDGKPNFVALHKRGNRLYAFAALWDDTQTYKPARGPGKIAIWDLAAGTRVGTIDMQSQSPAGWVREQPGGASVLIATVEDYSGTRGGIERIDLDANQSRGLFVTAAALGNRYVSDFAVAASGDGFVTAVDPASMDGESNLLAFTSTGQVAATPVLTGHPAGLAIDGCNHLWVVDRGYGANAPNGIHVVDVATQRELLATPVRMTLPPRFWGGVVFVP